MASPLPDSTAALEELAATLQLSTGSALTFALAPDEIRASAAAALNRRLKGLLAPTGPGEAPLQEVRLSPDPAALLRLVEMLPAEPRLRVLYVFGLEALPAERRAETLRALNFYRDRLRQSGAGFVFWVAPPALADVALFAPDLWSVRSGVFDLSGIPLEPLAQLRADYLAHLARAHRALDLKLPQLENFTRELLLEDVFVPLLARPELPAGETWERRLAGRGFDPGELEAGAGPAAVAAGIGAVPAPIEQALAE
ncbi:MAG: hypothetical protein HY784_01560, partial [Chloroflexi bacterium]|nr:hypothetical protein [Chloroflexota bacterium]